MVALQVFDDLVHRGCVAEGRRVPYGHFGKYINGYNQIAPYQAARLGRMARLQGPRLLQLRPDRERRRRAVRLGDTDYSADVLRDKVVNFIGTTSEPFFVEFTPKNPHGPATPAPRHVGSFSGVPPLASAELRGA